MTGSLLAFDPAFLLNIFFALLAIMFMITVHELGHYLAGKLLGFKINEFSIGMGPKLFSKKVGAGKKKKRRKFRRAPRKQTKSFTKRKRKTCLGTRIPTKKYFPYVQYLSADIVRLRERMRKPILRVRKNRKKTESILTG